MQFSVLAALAALAIAQPASAVIFTTTWNGTLVTGTDYAGVFGAAGGDLAGASYTATFSYDTSKGVTNAGQTSDFGFAPDSPASAVLIINGHVFDYAGAYASFIEADNHFAGHTSWYHNGLSDAAGDYRSYLFLEAIGFNGTSPTNIHTPFDGSYCLTNASLCGGSIQIYQQVNDGSYQLAVRASAGDPVFAVGTPEPATWALMIMGFGLVGSALRRWMARLRRSQAALQDAEIAEI